MKESLFLFLSFLFASVSDAYNYPYLTFRTVHGAEQSIAVESLSLTFTDGQLVARNADGQLMFTLPELSKMYFSADPLSVSPSLSEAASVNVEVFSVSGTYLGRFASVRQMRAVLARGIYIIRINNTIQKFVIE